MSCCMLFCTASKPTSSHMSYLATLTLSMRPSKWRLPLMSELKPSKDIDLKIIKDEILIAMDIFHSNVNNKTWAMLLWNLVTWTWKVSKVVTWIWSLVTCNVSNVRAKVKVNAKVPMHRSSSRNKNTSARLIITLILRKGTTRASRLGNHHLLLAHIAVAIIGIMVAHHAINNLIGSTIIWNSSSIHCVSPVRMSQRRPLTLITVHNASKIYDIRV